MTSPQAFPALSRWRRFSDLPRDGAAKTLIVSFAVCLVCSLVVSAAAVWLRPLHRQHLEREKQAHILQLLSQQPGLAGLLDGLETDAIETRIVEFATGAEVDDIDPATYDELAAAGDPAQSTAIPPDRDLARIERRASWAKVYVVRRAGRVRILILPVYGRGYGGIIHGYLALEGDGNTVAGVSFYKHSETPGIGSDIEREAWRNSWRGKRLRDDAGRLQFRIIEEDAPDAGEPVHRVDMISGATRSSQGVGNLIRFWMGDDGFGPYLRKFKQ